MRLRSGSAGVYVARVRTQLVNGPATLAQPRYRFYMQINRRLNGRGERRLPIIVGVRLSRGADLSSGAELAYTDNVSLHGARVVSSCAWQPGEHADIEPLKDGSPMHGEVVYCRSFGDAFYVGFKFQKPVTWSSFVRYQHR